MTHSINTFQFLHHCSCFTFTRPTEYIEFDAGNVVSQGAYDSIEDVYKKSGLYIPDTFILSLSH